MVETAFDRGRRKCFNLLMAAALVAMFHSSAESASLPGLPVVQVCKDRSHCIAAEIAATPEARLRGLMFRENLPEGRGMLFVCPQSDYWDFWMKNTKMPLDIIWLDQARRVVHIVDGARPCARGPCRTYTSEERAAYVLESVSGMSKKWQLNIGDQLIFELPADVAGRPDDNDANRGRRPRDGVD
ncbi:MAG: DUF192 domain-containing protein [Candidatus Sulfobium sp.]|jgi:uncharacterized membrane protein (UPF0127 family)